MKAPDSIDITTVIDNLVERTGLPLIDQDRAELLRTAPIVLRIAAQLRIPEVRYAEFAPVFPAALER